MIEAVNVQTQSMSLNIEPYFNYFYE